MSAAAVRVVKIGGSLLDYEELLSSWNRWFTAQRKLPTVIVVGGGPFADQVRRWDDQCQLPEELAHWMCVTAMGLTAALLHHQVSSTQLVEQWQDLRELVFATEIEVPVIFSVETFLRLQEPELPGCRLPHSWAVTSDSIAGRLAEVLCAEELVLCKSTSPSTERDWNQWAIEGLVDPFFPEVATKIPSIRWVNLRSTHSVSRS